MKNPIFLLVPLIFFFLSLSPEISSQSVIIDGNAFLQGQSAHEGIKVLFERFAPAVLFDTAWTDVAGYYSIELQEGLYNVVYSKSGFLGQELTNIQAYSNQTLPDVTLEPEGISGSLSGTISRGNYVISGDINIKHDHELIIEPGTRFMFMSDTRFEIKGLLVAEGTPGDSIYFTSYDQSAGWKGIQFTQSTANCVLSYAVVEYCKVDAISVYFCSPSIHNSTIRFNHNLEVTSYGGGINLHNSQTVLDNLRIYGNEATWGGGIYVSTIANYWPESYHPVIANCLIYENTAEEGGGVYFYTWIYDGIQTYPLLINSTIARNHSSAAVSGYDNCVMPDIISNTIAFNDGYGIMSTKGYINYCGYNDVSNNTDGNFFNPPQWIGENITVNQNGDSCDAYHNIQYNPLFTNLDELEFHLSIESPCLDAGLNDSVVTQEDFDGHPRITRALNFETVDMGAYEYLHLGTDEISGEQNSPVIFPNPSPGLFTITYILDKQADVSLRIIDCQGQILYYSAITDNPAGEGRFQWDASALAAGVYYYKLITDKESYSGKLIRVN